MLTRCSDCGKDVSSNARQCPHCGNPIDLSVRCPKCGSKDTKVISGASKVGSLLLVGIFAANKILSKNVCNSCNHKF